MALRDFVKQANDWFDVANSHSLEHRSGNPLKAALEVHWDHQVAALEAMLATVQDLVVVGKQGLMVWQKSLIISTKSLLSIRGYIKSTYGVDHVITARLNQDALEGKAKTNLLG